MKVGYKKFFIMQGISLVVMFAVMYSMVDVWDHIYLNINRFYMAFLMVLPMTVIMLMMMSDMYTDRKKNMAIISLALAAFVGVFFLVRTQGFVGNQAFLRSMIPHHSSAILMCQEADITDQEILDLCDNIIQVQRVEIQQMEDIMERLGDN